MVLGCDLDFPCFQVLNRVVAAPVAEFQLVGTRTVCKREKQGGLEISASLPDSDRLQIV